MSQRFRAPNADSALHNRAALLGAHDYYSTPPSSGRSSPFGGAGGSGSGYRENPYGAGQRFADDLEGQNDEALEGLTAKVKILKDITIGIGQEVRDSTVQLSQMNDAFAETSGILKGTFRRMNNMASRQGCRWLWYIVFLVLVFWFFIVVWWFRR
ncbi:SNARE domain-containing protein [Phanerochaete sordida]|uniref:SNARE domain-containing protein n=1 Tax=Phanerochaete sordida TaxID=48140 RepID=A0A9P3G3V6_9APHY|nr:SNARE domain-containing protein [Phanerochaete sordida]